MVSILTRVRFVFAIVAIATIPAGAVFAADGAHQSGGFNSQASRNHGAGQTVFTSRGPVVTTGGAGTYHTTTLPSGGGQGILMNNGNGTSTLTGPGGVVTTVPSGP